ncbi:MAG: EAL domain-containing protein [Chromatiaceae bacterium]|nr:EAL domain-containing protein [Gammaproteobacteria bacterium]MCP5318478.1 EAL domain-containing protein [Chromatiaceae bacterium]
MSAIRIGRRRVVAALLGLLVVVLALGIAIRNDLQLANTAFHELDDEIETTLTRRLDNLNASLRSLSGMHHAMTRLSQQELSAFGQEIGRSHPYVRAILQLRLVDAGERAAYEESFQEAGFPTFAITANGESGDLVPSPARPGYMALSFVEPLDPGLARFLGLDFYSRADLREAIDQAVRSGEISAAPATPIGKGAFLLLKAVYKGFFVPTTESERLAQVHGVYGLVVDVPAFLADIGGGPGLHLSTWNTERPVTLFRQPEAAQPDWVARFLPDQHADIDISLDPTRFRISIDRTLDSRALRPAQWMTVTATFVGLYLAGVLVVFTRLRATEAARDAKEQLFQEKERAQVTLQSIGEAVITTDPTGVVDFLNPAAAQLTGWGADDARGRHLNEIFSLVSEKDGTGLPDPIARALRDHDESEAAALMIRSDGATIAVIENAAAIRDSDGHFTGAALIVRDVSRERNLLREMAFQATHDPLTRLINRRQFERELAAVVDDALNSDSQHALMYIDLDQFKAINDSCGHMAGDQLLKQVASHLGENIRRLDRLARLGGDEFGVLLRDCSIEKALEVAEALRHEIKDLRLHWEDKTFRISLSVGVVAISQQSGSLDEVLRAADAACYVAKDQGRNRVHFYQPDDQMLAKRSSDMQWLQRLREAIDNDQLVLFGQSIFPLNADSPHPAMCELLVRMVDADGRIVPPMTFIPAAERFNLMFDLDLWVIGAAFRQLATLWQHHPQDRRIFTINLSGQSLDHPDLELAIQRLEVEHKIEPHRICFEITETSVIGNMDRALALMDSLRRRGFLFALDDFGTGLSSFAYLKKLPVDYLKIDGEFVRDILHDPVDKAMVDTIRRIGGVLGMTTIAEAIEDADTCALLTAMGIDYGQGYHLAKPAPGEFAPVISNVVALPARK